jgi:hypothetical protein
MTKKLLSLSAIGGLMLAAGAVSAQAAPVGSMGLHVDATTVQKAHYDGDRRWDNDRPWWRRDRDYNDRGSYRRWWWHRHHSERYGDRDHDRDDYRQHRRDWR